MNANRDWKLARMLMQSVCTSIDVALGRPAKERKEKIADACADLSLLKGYWTDGRLPDVGRMRGNLVQATVQLRLACKTKMEAEDRERTLYDARAYVVDALRELEQHLAASRDTEREYA